MPKIKMHWKFWLAWCVPAVAMVAVAQFTPDAVTEVGHPGTFLTATAHPGGWLVPDTTVVQTSHATLVLKGLLSSERGQPVILRDTTRQGLVACTGIAGCLPLEGAYAGPMTAVPHGWALPYGVTDTLHYVGHVWLWVGLPLWLLLQWTLYRMEVGDGAADPEDT